MTGFYIHTPDNGVKILLLDQNADPPDTDEVWEKGTAWDTIAEAITATEPMTVCEVAASF